MRTLLHPLLSLPLFLPLSLSTLPTPALGTDTTTTTTTPDTGCAVLLPGGAFAFAPPPPDLANRADADEPEPEPEPAPDLYLNLTAIAGRGNVSVLECWRLDEPFAVSRVPGSALTLDLGELDGAALAVLPPGWDGGVHHAPARQYVWFVTGLIHFTLPNATGEAWIYGGKYGLIFAADTADVSGWGHLTEYPGNTETVGITIPVKDGIDPKHTVLHDGPCEMEDLVNL